MGEQLENNIEATLAETLQAVGTTDVTALQKEIDALKTALAAAEAKVAEHWDRLLRKEAETQDIRRRADRTVQDAKKYALDRFLQDFMMVFDSLEQGLGTATPSPLLEGMTLTFKLLVDTLAKFEVRILDPKGETFNPAMHEAISMQSTSEVPANQIIAVVQKGVMLHDRLIRPARVVVATLPA